MSIGVTVLASGTGDSEALVAAKYNLRLVGFSISEDAGSTAVVKLYNGATIASGSLVVAPMSLAANGFGMWGIDPRGIPCHNGLTVERVSGTTTVVLYIDYP